LSRLSLRFWSFHVSERMKEERGKEGGGEYQNVLVRIPPVGGARGRAASTENALVEAIQLGPVLLRLVNLLPVHLLRTLAVQPRLHALVLDTHNAKKRTNEQAKQVLLINSVSVFEGIG